MNVVGLDISLGCTGAASAAMAGGARESTRFEVTTKRHLVDRVSLMADRCCAWVRDRSVALVVLEGYAYGPRVQLPVVEAVGSVKVELRRRSVPFIVVPPPLLKKAATGRGNADKPAMIEAARAVVPYRLATDDEADAIHLAMFGVAWLSAAVHGAPPTPNHYDAVAGGWQPGRESTVCEAAEVLAGAKR